MITFYNINTVPFTHRLGKMTKHLQHIILLVREKDLNLCLGYSSELENNEFKNSLQNFIDDIEVDKHLGYQKSNVLRDAGTGSCPYVPAFTKFLIIYGGFIIKNEYFPGIFCAFFNE